MRKTVKRMSSAPPTINKRYVTNGFADPLKNYDGPYKEGIKPTPEKAEIFTPKPMIRDGHATPGPEHIRAKLDVTTGVLRFSDYPVFQPNLAPYEVLLLGSFGGTYFRSIYSKPAAREFDGPSVFAELPYADWGLGNKQMVAEIPRVGPGVNTLAGAPFNQKKHLFSNKYDVDVNRFGVKCGGSLDMWESSGWINAEDPYGWFQWYCWFYLGRRTSDDERQIARWKGAASEMSARFRKQLINKCKAEGKALSDISVSPVIRQTLQHWGVDVRELPGRVNGNKRKAEPTKTGGKRVKK